MVITLMDMTSLGTNGSPFHGVLLKWLAPLSGPTEGCGIHIADMWGPLRALVPSVKDDVIQNCRLQLAFLPLHHPHLMTVGSVRGLCFHPLPWFLSCRQKPEVQTIRCLRLVSNQESKGLHTGWAYLYMPTVPQCSVPSSDSTEHLPHVPLSQL